MAQSRSVDRVTELKLEPVTDSEPLAKLEKRRYHWCSRPRVQPVSEDVLRYLYLDKKLNMKELHNILGRSIKTIMKWMDAYKIPRRTMSEVAKITPKRKREAMLKSINGRILENPKKPHSVLVKEELSKLGKQGFKVINLDRGPIPDGILIDFDDRRVYAVEIEKHGLTRRKLSIYQDIKDYDDIVWIVGGDWEVVES